jgi:hypothetical protein
VIGIPDENPAGARLLLEVAFQTEGCAPFRQHALVHGTMRGMTTEATFPHRFVFEDKWAALGGMTLKTGVVLTEQCRAAALERLRQVRSTAFDRVALVRVMAIGATHFAFENRVMMRQFEFRPHFGVALETGRRRFPRIDDLVAIATAFHMETSGPVARLASHIPGVIALRL